MLNKPNNFEALYQCRIEATGQKLYRLKPTVFSPTLPFYEGHKDVAYTEEEVAIKMPQSEYERFMNNWNQYMRILQTAADNPLIKEQYHQLLMLTELYR